MWVENALAVPLGIVKWNFERYGLLDGQVRFSPGWFEETLPSIPVSRLALLRIDVDLYESAIVALRGLYSRLSPAGYVIVDEYGTEGCRAAVEDFRKENRIVEPMGTLASTGAYWRKVAGAAAPQKGAEHSISSVTAGQPSTYTWNGGTLFAQPGSHYSPVVDPDDKHARFAFHARDRWEWAGQPVNFNQPDMLQLLSELAVFYPRQDFPRKESPEWRYYFDNPAFTYGDALTWFCLLLKVRPKRNVEVGAGSLRV